LIEHRTGKPFSTVLDNDKIRQLAIKYDKRCQLFDHCKSNTWKDLMAAR